MYWLWYFCKGSQLLPVTWQVPGEALMAISAMTITYVSAEKLAGEEWWGVSDWRMKQMVLNVLVPQLQTICTWMHCSRHVQCLLTTGQMIVSFWKVSPGNNKYTKNYHPLCWSTQPRRWFYLLIAQWFLETIPSSDSIHRLHIVYLLVVTISTKVINPSYSLLLLIVN